MGENNRRVLVAAIAVTVLAAVFVSFGLPALTSRIPQVTLADLDQPAPQEPDQQFLPVEVTPDTVQSVIATLSRPESYSRSMTVTLFWGENGRGDQQVQMWADDGWVKTTVTSGSGVPADSRAADLAQHIPTYEDVLTADKGAITEASYVTRGEKSCIYVEVRQGETDAVDRYWIETATGLLAFCETAEGGKTVYSMEETAYSAPLEETAVFTLPDGTMPSSIQEEGGG